MLEELEIKRKIVLINMLEYGANLKLINLLINIDNQINLIKLKKIENNKI